jgi:hypothetical protein
MAGFASPSRLRLQVFSTSWRFGPPRACRPCFMPDPLMGLRPPEPCSLFAAVRRFRRRSPRDIGQRPSPSHRSQSSPKRPLGPATERLGNASPPSGFRTAKRSATRHRWFRPDGARSSPGLWPSRVFPPAGTTGGGRSPLTSLADRARTTEPAAPQGLHSAGMGSSLSRPPTLLGFSRLVTTMGVRAGRGSGVTSSGSGVRHRPLPSHL